MMPASDAALATIVELIVFLATAFVTRVPEGVGVSDIDRRYSLVRSLTGNIRGVGSASMKPP